MVCFCQALELQGSANSNSKSLRNGHPSHELLYPSVTGYKVDATGLLIKALPKVLTPEIAPLADRIAAVSDDRIKFI